MTPEVKDMFGRVVTEGDRVAVALSYGNHGSTLQTGRVLKIGDKMMSVLWEQMTKPTSVHHTLKKFIVINELPQQP